MENTYMLTYIYAEEKNVQWEKREFDNNEEMGVD